MNFKKQFALAVGAMALTAAFAVSAQAQQAYPYAPQYGYQQAPSPLVTEDRLMASGCGLINRNIGNGTLIYGCPADVQIQTQPEDSGPRCSYQGLASGNRGYVQEQRFVCRENRANYDQDQPRYGRDYYVAPTPDGPVAVPPQRYVPYYNDQNNGQNGNQGRRQQRRGYNP